MNRHGLAVLGWSDPNCHTSPAGIGDLHFQMLRPRSQVFLALFHLLRSELRWCFEDWAFAFFQDPPDANETSETLTFRDPRSAK